jgi:hypothetical protein
MDLKWSAVRKEGGTPVEQDGSNLFDAGDAVAGADGFFAEVEVEDGAGSGPVRIKRRRHQLQ